MAMTLNTRILWLMMIIVTLQKYMAVSIAIRALKGSMIKRDANIAPTPTELECIQMVSESGDYWYQSPGGSSVCGLYLIGSAEQMVEIEFTDFDITCEEGGLLATLDGWETQGQIFPGSNDHMLSMSERYKTYCGDTPPSRTLTTSQNVGLLQFRIPVEGQGFRVSITFINNPQPCNIISMDSNGTYTLRNYGLRRNCTVSYLYPETITILDLNVGRTAVSPLETAESGTQFKCEEDGSDFAELLSGEGLDTELMARTTSFCGLDSTPDVPVVHVACPQSVVRLVSSGRYFNSVTYRHTKLTSLDQPEGLLVMRCTA